MKPNRALSGTIEMSHAEARPTPPPVQCPAMRPMTGLGQSMIADMTSTREWRGLFSDLPLRSAPAQNVLPALVRSTTCMMHVPRQ